MSTIQSVALRALQEKPLSTVGVGMKLDTTVNRADRVMRTMMKQGLVALDDDGWQLTDKGRKRLPS